MAKSMTGYGKAERVVGPKKILVEIRSLNSKQLDLSVKFPTTYRDLEPEIRNRVGRELLRGKIDVYITEELSPTESSVSVNSQLFEHHFNALTALARENELKSDSELQAAMFMTVFRFPDVLTTVRENEPVEESQALLDAVEEAISRLNAFRLQEGDTLMTDILARIDLIERMRVEIEPFEKRRTQVIRGRIRESVASLGVSVDDNRLEQEMIFYIEKLDITEEKVRLQNHLRYFHEVAEKEENVGRKLGFISQEIGREINTLGSKASDSDIQRRVVVMKDELEKIKEQILNIL